MTAGILHTCVVIDLAFIDPSELPDDQWVTTITLGELSVGPLVATAPAELERRQAVLQATESRFAESMIPYDDAAARVYGPVAAGARRRGQSSRTRISDFQIAAIAIANQLPLYTVNVADFMDIDGLDLRAVAAHEAGTI